MYLQSHKKRLVSLFLFGATGIFAYASASNQTLAEQIAPINNGTAPSIIVAPIGDAQPHVISPTGNAQVSIEERIIVAPDGALHVYTDNPQNNSKPVLKWYSASEPINASGEEIPLVAVFMVKNEDHIIKQTLEPYINAGIKHFFIFDTGSTDKTVEATLEYFKERGITQYGIAQEPFVDFATSRNRGLDLAWQKFPTAAFLTMPDAEWYLRNGEKLIEFCKQNAHKDVHITSYSVRIMNTNLDFYTPRLIRNVPRLANTGPIPHFEGVVHEVVMPTFGAKVPGDVYFELIVGAKGAAKSQKRWERDRDLLLKFHQEHPKDPRTAFYLAQTYDCLGDLENSHKYYKLRCELQGWDEENFIAVYRLAVITERLSGTKPTEYTWGQALELYLKAYAMRSHRIEPLIKMAAHYWEEAVKTPKRNSNVALAFFFARRALEIPYPQNDLLFVEKSIYDVARYEMISKTAYDVGECPLGLRATQHLIKQRFDTVQLYRNRDVYLECSQPGTDLWGYNMTRS